jgi:hypothetical protein
MPHPFNTTPNHHPRHRATPRHPITALHHPSSPRYPWRWLPSHSTQRTSGARVSLSTWHPTLMTWQVRERVFPVMSAAYDVPIDALRLHECFVVRYDARGGQPSLPMHRDQTLLSFNVTLHCADEGGGTCFATPARVVECTDGARGLRCAADLDELTAAEACVVSGARGDCVRANGRSHPQPDERCEPTNHRRRRRHDRLRALRRPVRGR